MERRNWPCLGASHPYPHSSFPSDPQQLNSSLLRNLAGLLLTLWGSVCCLVNCIYLHLRPCWAGGAHTEEEKGINKVGSAQLLDSSQSDGETGPLSSPPRFSSSSSAARVIFKNCFKRQTRFLLSPSAPHSESLPPVAAFWLLRGAIQRNLRTLLRLSLLSRVNFCPPLHLAHCTYHMGFSVESLLHWMVTWQGRDWSCPFKKWMKKRALISTIRCAEWTISLGIHFTFGGYQ